MRFNLIPVLVAGATLVAASPIRVEVIAVGEEFTPFPVRFGHATHPGNNENVAKLIKPGSGRIEKWHKKPCGRMGRPTFRQKAAELSNAFRKALGLPVIEIIHFEQHKKIEEQEFHILPFIGTPQAIENMPGVDNHPVPHPHLRPHHHHEEHHEHPHHHHHHLHRPHHGPHGPHQGPLRFLRQAPFGDRFVVALSMLGKWEGRAVAFVFGAGLGVLLRMFYVLAVVAYRTARRSGREEEEHYVLFVEEIAEEEHQPTPAAVAPPTYTPDEKAPIAPISN